MSTTAADEQDQEQCKALTDDGERCSRPAQDDGFCYQHDESDETIDDSDAEEAETGAETGGEAEAEDENEAEAEDENEAEAEDENEAEAEAGDEVEAGDEAETQAEDEDEDEETREETAESGADDQTQSQQQRVQQQQDNENTMSSGDAESADANTGIVDVREKVQSITGAVVGHPLDGITSVDRTDEGWRVAVEVVERNGVPDTQDILGRYEIRMDDELNVGGYQRTHRYRRDDMDHDI